MNGYWKFCLPMLLLGATAFPALAAQDAPDIQKQDAGQIAYQRWQTAAAQTLATRDDADSLYTAALLELFPVTDADGTMHARKHGRRRSLSLLDQAASLEPDAADIAAQALLTCSQMAHCDIATYADRYRSAAPDDALVWLPALHVAMQQHDDAKVTDIIQSMGSAHHFGSYWIAAGERAQRGLAHVAIEGLPPQTKGLTRDTLAMFRNTSASVLAFLTAAPSYVDLSKACRPTVAAFAERRSACRDIGLLLEDGGSSIDSLIGLLLHRLAASSDADYADAVASGRRMDWQSRLYYSKLPYTRPSGAADWKPTPEQINRMTAISTRFTAAIRKHHGEVAGIQALLAQAGLPLDPPADWVDKQQQYRLADDARILKAAASQSCKK